MNSDNQNSIDPFNARLEALAESTAFTFKIHSDMIMSIDTKLDRMAERQNNAESKMETLTANLQTLTDSVSALAEKVDKLADHGARLETKLERLADMTTGIFASLAGRVSTLESKP